MHSFEALHLWRMYIGVRIEHQPHMRNHLSATDWLQQTVPAGGIGLRQQMLHTGHIWTIARLRATYQRPAYQDFAIGPTLALALGLTVPSELLAALEAKLLRIPHLHLSVEHQPHALAKPNTTDYRHEGLHDYVHEHIPPTQLSPRERQRILNTGELWSITWATAATAPSHVVSASTLTRALTIASKFRAP